MNTKSDKLVGKVQKKININTKNIKPIRKTKWSDLLNFSSAVIGVLATAIIYFEGWVYASSWYGFFNIDMAQIVLPTPIILIDGIPAITVALFVLILSIIITLVINIFFHRHNLSRSDTSLLAFFSTGFFTITMFLLQRYLYPIILLETHVNNGVTKYKFGMVQNSNITSLAFSDELIYAVLILALSILLFLILVQVIVKNTNSRLRRSVRKSSFVIYNLLQQLSQTWQIGACILLLVYLFMPLLLSSEIGRIDALRGRHLVSGTHLLPSVEVQSDAPIQAMQKIENKSDVSGQYDYGPLLLVYSDNNSYYLAENIPGQTYYDTPNTYYIQRTSNNHIVLILKPKFSQTTEIINGILSTNKSHPATPSPTSSLP